MVRHTALGTWQSMVPIPMSSLHGGEGSLCPVCVPPEDMVNSESVVGIKSGNSCVVIGYQVDECSHTWSVEHLLLNHTFILVEPGCKDYSFSDHAVNDFEYGLDSILTDSVDTQELDASFDVADAMPSSFSSWSLHLISIICYNFRLQFAPSIKHVN